MHPSEWTHRLLQTFLTLAYLQVCWYISVNAAFSVDGIGCTNASTIVAWSLVLLLDIGLNLNTVQLSNGKSIRTRRSILLEYLQRELYNDIGVAIYLLIDHLDVKQELDITIHLIILLGVFIKLNRKCKLLRICFAFKKYVVMIESVLFLLGATHFSVHNQST